MKMNTKNRIFVLFLTAVLTIIVVAFCVDIYQTNYRKGIREYIADYNVQVEEYNRDVEQKNSTVNSLKNLKYITPIPEEIAEDKDIRGIYDKIEKYKRDNDYIMYENDATGNGVFWH